jgi:hypothetical protein
VGYKSAAPPGRRNGNSPEEHPFHPFLLGRRTKAKTPDCESNRHSAFLFLSVSLRLCVAHWFSFRPRAKAQPAHQRQPTSDDSALTHFYMSDEYDGGKILKFRSGDKITSIRAGFN